MNERTHFFIKIYLSHFIRKCWCWLCVRSELETGKDCYILIQSSSDHSNTTFAFWLGWSTVGRWGPKALSLQAYSHAGILSPNGLQLQLELELTEAVCDTWFYNCLTLTCFLWAYASATIIEFNPVHRSSWYSDIFDRMHLFRCSSAYLHRCIVWLTARSRVNILQGEGHQFLIGMQFDHLFVFIGLISLVYSARWG